jgi:hypothetical protein
MGDCVASPRFRVGDDNWVLRYYPNGRLSAIHHDSFISLVHDYADARAVNAKARSISVLDKDALPVPHCHHPSVA